MNGLTDIHQHVLWGLDDGAQTPQMMHGMLRAAHRQQIRRIVAAAHVCPGFKPFDKELYARRLDEAREYCDKNRLGIELFSGAEIAWTYNTADALFRRKIPTINETDHVLIELWHDISWREVRTAVKALLHEGFTPVLAHVERYGCFVLNPERALEMRDELSIHYQVNANTVLAKNSFFVRRFMDKMLNARGFDALASDAHDCEFRPQNLREAWEVLKIRCGAEYADSLVNFGGILK